MMVVPAVGWRDADAASTSVLVGDSERVDGFLLVPDEWEQE